MSDCQLIRRELGAYVLGGLEPDETEAVREHLTHCADCARQHASIAGLPDLLALAEPIETSPPLGPAVEERVLDAVARERGRPAPRRRPRVLRWRVAIPLAAALAAVALAVFLVADRGDGPQGGYQLALHPVGGSGAGGRARLESSSAGTTVRLWVRDLPADPNVVYEVQCDAPGWTASAGTFRADARGRAVVVLSTAMRRGEYDALRVVRRSREATTDILTASLH